MIFPRLPFDAVFADESGGNIKTPQGEYLSLGAFPIVDQGKALIGGYIDDPARLCGGGRPAIVFGDHTRCIKHVDFPFCMGADGVKVLRPKIDADLKYLYHYLKTLKLPDAGYDRHFKYLKRTDVVVPPLPEQRRIAAILDQADALRAKRREALAQLDSLTQSIFIEMFGDPVKGNGLYAVESVESIAAPERYSIVDGPFGSSMKPDDYRKSGVPVVRIANITKNGDFTDRNLLYIDKALFEKLKRSSIMPNDVLVSRVGTIGNTCVFPEGIGDALLSTTGVCKITTDRKRVLPEFLHQAILQPAFQEQIHKSASTSVQKYFNLSALKGWSIVVPPISVQQDFVKKLTTIKNQKSMLIKSLDNIESLFSSLQHRAFRGEL